MQKNNAPDFDLVMFIHDVSHPFGSKLDNFIDLLRAIPELRDVCKTKISVQLTYSHPTEGESKFDLLPTENHAKQTNGVQDVG